LLNTVWSSWLYTINENRSWHYHIKCLKPANLYLLPLFLQAFPTCYTFSFPLFVDCLLFLLLLFFQSLFYDLFIFRVVIFVFYHFLSFSHSKPNWVPFIQMDLIPKHWLHWCMRMRHTCPISSHILISIATKIALFLVFFPVFFILPFLYSIFQ
jgi:hypothetical protein